MPYPYSLDDYVNELKAYMRKNNLIKPNVLAHSFGARVAVKCASEDLFDRIVITGGAGLKPKSTFKKQIKRCTFKFLKVFVKKEKLKTFYSSDYLKLSPVMQKSFIKVVNEHLEDSAKLIKNKTLLIYGSNDKETPLYMGERYNKLIKNSQLKVMKGAGHFCFLDNVPLFLYYLNEFLLSDRSN